MMKRVLPFVLTLFVGTIMGSLPHLFKSRVNRAQPVTGTFSYRRGPCAHYSRGRFNDWPEEIQGAKGKFEKDSRAETPVVILAKPDPRYTAAARKNRTAGVVQLRAVFRADGEVTNILPIKTLPDGLTEEAINAAQRIQFTPAQINGMPISVERLIEYNFSLY